MSPDKKARQRFIIGSAWLMVPAPLVLLGLTHAVLPAMSHVEEPVARLPLVSRWLVVATLPYIAMCFTIAWARFFEGAHDPTLGGESNRLAIHCRVMQNTLEQLVWFAINVFALAPMLEPAYVKLVPVACVVFALARLLYWRGYLREGTLGRAPGVQATLSLNFHLTLAALVLLGRTLLAG